MRHSYSHPGVISSLLTQSVTTLDLTDQINDDGDLQSRGPLQVPGAVTQTVPVVRGVGPLPVRVAVSGGIDCT